MPKSGQCFSCGCIVDEVEKREVNTGWSELSGIFEREHFEFCWLCITSNLALSSADKYQLSNKETCKVVCHVGNEILKAIKELKK